MNEKIVQLRDQIKQLQQEIKNIQNCCSHDKITYEYGGNTGNYDPTSDSYWVTVDCLCCNAHMKFYDDEEMYNEYRNVYGKELCISKSEYEVCKKYV